MSSLNSTPLIFKICRQPLLLKSPIWDGPRAIDYVKSDRGRLVISRILRVGSALVSCPLMVYGSIKSNVTIIIPSAFTSMAGFIGGVLIKNPNIEEAVQAGPTDSQNLAINSWIDIPTSPTQESLTVKNP